MTPGAVADAALGALLLDELDASGIPYAVLHGEAELSRGLLRSDVDLVVGVPIADVVSRLCVAAEKAGAGLIMVNPYDEGGLATFWLRRDWSGGVQIDLLRDPDGYSKLAFKTDVALRHVVRGARWLTLTPPAERAYLLSKRWLKGDTEALGNLRDGGDEAERPLLEILTRRRARLVVPRGTVRRPQSSSSRTLPLLRSRLSLRILRRMRHPVGMLIGLTGNEEACLQATETIRAGLGPLAFGAERVEALPLPNRLRRYVSLRKPSILIRSGESRERPDIRVAVEEGADQDGTLDLIWREMVSLTAAKVERQIRVHNLDH